MTLNAWMAHTLEIRKPHGGHYEDGITVLAEESEDGISLQPLVSMSSSPGRGAVKTLEQPPCTPPGQPALIITSPRSEARGLPKMETNPMFADVTVLGFSNHLYPNMHPTLAPAPSPPVRPAPVSPRARLANSLAEPSKQHQADNASEQSLRERLLATVHSHRMPDYQQNRPEHQLAPNHIIDPAIAGSGMMNPNAAAEGSGGEDGHGAKRGRRELSNSKRAAQNRAAQRAFRQRKEGHIKTLENQVREFNTLNNSYKAIQAENYTLREYVISLQGRLLEAQGEYPPPPAHIDLQAHRNNTAGNNAPVQANSPVGQEELSGRAPTAPMRSLFSNEFRATAAQAVAEHKHRNEGTGRINAGPDKRMMIDDGPEATQPSNGLPPSTAP
ncbi:MAG: hypothetical protein Q9163_000436 [Psora crenata]